MRLFTPKRHCLLAIFALMVFLPSVSTAQASCDKRGRIHQDTDVYREVPRYVTGRGWQGERIATLRVNTLVYICAEQNGAFGFSSKTWYQIAYEGARKSWQYGWVLKDNVTLSSNTSGGTGFRVGIPLVAAAFAGEPQASSQGKTARDPGPPPPPPPPSEEKSASVSDEPSSTSLADLGELYWPLFLAMLIGMLAKAGVDWLDSSDRAMMRQHLRNALVSLLVSPIVFLGFLNAGQFSTSPQTFVVLWLLAFQNGFFWQTVLKRNVRGNAPAEAAGS
jgi:hypothetical protein